MFRLGVKSAPKQNPKILTKTSAKLCFLLLRKHHISFSSPVKILENVVFELCHPDSGKHKIKIGLSLHRKNNISSSEDKSRDKIGKRQ